MFSWDGGREFEKDRLSLQTQDKIKSNWKLLCLSQQQQLYRTGRCEEHVGINDHDEGLDGWMSAQNNVEITTWQGARLLE